MQKEQSEMITSTDIPVYIDLFDYFYDFLKGKNKMSSYDPYSLPNKQGS